MQRFSKFFHSDIIINVDAVMLLALFFITFDLFCPYIVSTGRLAIAPLKSARFLDLVMLYNSPNIKKLNLR